MSTGPTAPIDSDALANDARMGLGRHAQEAALVATETASRRQLAVEAHLLEDAATREERMRGERERAATREHVQDIRKAFFCEVRRPLRPRHVTDAKLAAARACRYLCTLRLQLCAMVAGTPVKMRGHSVCMTSPKRGGRSGTEKVVCATLDMREAVQVDSRAR